MRVIRRVNIIVPAVILAIITLSGCGILYRQRSVVFEAGDFAPLVQELATENRDLFNNPYTLIVMLDRSPCGVRLYESIFWAQWQRRMLDSGNGFIFATSREDSAGLIYAAHLDSVDAPVLVLESYADRISRPADWRVYGPFHLLSDSTGRLIGMWLAVLNEAANVEMLNMLDSLIVGDRNTSKAQR